MFISIGIDEDGRPYITTSDGSREKVVRKGKGKSVIDFPSTYTVLDIETTGLDPIKDKIIQIGATKCSFDGTVLIPEDNLNVYINPEISISEFTENFTGRTNEFYAS